MPAGRPTALTDDVQRIICAHIKEGNYLHVAARAAGVSRRTVTAWIKNGRQQEEGIFHDFYLAISKAEVEAEIAAVRRLNELAKKDAKIIQWWLACKHPRRWGQDRNRIEKLTKTVAELEAAIHELLVGAEARKKGGQAAQPG